MGNLTSRVLVAAVGLPAVVGLIYLGGWPLAVVVAAAAALATWEFYGLAGIQGVHPFRILGTLASVAVVLVVAAYPTANRAALAVVDILVGVTLLSLAMSVGLRGPEGTPMAAVGSTVLGVLYVGCTMAFAPILRWVPDALGGGPHGPSLYAGAFLILPLATTWLGDTAAYFAGSAWGKRKLAPTASPNKTVEGALAGLAASAGAAVLVVVWARQGEVPGLAISLWTAAWMGALLGAAAQVGDLAESILKREAGVKDSGRLLLGHGGFLDRLDALLFALPVTFGLLRLVGIGP